MNALPSNATTKCTTSGSSIVIVCGILLLAMVGLVLNITILVFFVKHALRTIINKMFSVLILTDALVCFFYPFHMTFSNVLRCRYGSLLYSESGRFSTLTVFVEIIPIIWIYLSQSFTTVISVFRYLSIKYPLRPISDTKVYCGLGVSFTVSVTLILTSHNCNNPYHFLIAVVFFFNIIASAVSGILSIVIISSKGSTTKVRGNQTSDGICSQEEHANRNRIRASKTVLILVCVYTVTNLVCVYTVTNLVCVYTVTNLVCVYTVTNLVCVYTVTNLVCVYTVTNLVCVYTVTNLVCVYTVTNLVCVYTVTNLVAFLPVLQKQFSSWYVYTPSQTW